MTNCSRDGNDSENSDDIDVVDADGERFNWQNFQAVKL